ncbi:XRE family transcriptional regulator [Bosea sp. (in: a-proteobacteria)]|uniref:helix-turn-helix domain-containing protein n=1 Tax=Bosea sp. (in: a-proteobacteria) TaxID=1871050 RepID=UPI002736C5EA|nr:XRE family transcriptional regulator [Bosea sp. (in: a-proteobacteria)]
MAREARAMRQGELASLIDRVPPTISKWENEDQSQRPEPAVLPRLADALQVETSWFFKPLEQEHSASFFRSLVGELELMRAKARARLGFVEAIEEAISNHIELPDVDIPDLMEGHDFLSLRKEDIEFAANSLRDHWDIGDGPIDDLLLVIENAGIVVAEDQIGSPKLDGLSRWSFLKERPYMLLAQDKRVGVRRRLDAAHELAHIVLHKAVNQKDLQENFKLIEEQAMMFAGAFLLPAEAYEDDIYSLSLDAMLSVKSKWKVSVAAQIKRLANLDKFSHDYERRLWQYYSYRKWRSREPLDDVLEIEKPQNLKDSIEMMLGDNIVTRDELVRDIGISRADIVSLTGIAGAYFEPAPDNLVRMRPKIREASDSNQTNSAEIFTLGGRRR